jgi:hypothetical protein
MFHYRQYSPRQGPEQLAFSSRKRRCTEKSDAESDALSGDPALFDPDLQLILDKWSDLPKAIKVAILTLVQSVGGVRA